MDSTLRRRDFLKGAALAGAALPAGLAWAAAPKDKKLTLADTIPTRVFGKTGITLPILGYGGAALGFQEGHPCSCATRDMGNTFDRAHG